MELTLTIENETSLENGAPLSVALREGESLDIGRNAQIAWPLPDASRFISGKHCEVRFRDGGFWLYDVSTNGTFLNDDSQRLSSPHRLRDGDRIAIGPYVILARVAGDAAKPAAVDPPAAPVDFIITEVAPRAPDSAFGLELERQGAPAASAKPAPGETDEPAAPRPVVFRPARRAAAPISLSIEDDFDEPAPDWANLTGASRAAAPAVAAAREEQVAAGPAEVAAADLRAGDESPPASGLSAPVVDPPAVAREPAPAATPRLPRASADDGLRREAATTADAAEDAGAFIRRFAQGAGIPEHIFARRDPLDVAEELGALIYLVTEGLKYLLGARHAAKRFTRAGSQTMIQALDNNPLKFAPTAEDALKIMLAPRTRSYLGAEEALAAAFADLKSHQIKTFSAMQGAVRMLVEDLDPAGIEAAAGPEEGKLAGLLANRKSRLWDLFLARWQAKTMRHQDGIVDAFMLYFAECYDQASE